jgi:hypothetical protein
MIHARASVPCPAVTHRRLVIVAQKIIARGSIVNIGWQAVGAKRRLEQQSF